MKHFKTLVTANSFAKSKELMSQLTALPVEICEVPAFDNTTDLSEIINKHAIEILIVSLAPIKAATILNSPSLKFIAKYGVGIDNIDVETLKQRQIGLGWTQGLNNRSVSELVVGFALSHFRNILPSVVRMRNGVWTKDGGRQLSNATVGIVGLGNIGLDVAKLMKGFGCKVQFFDLVDKRDAAAKHELIPTDYRSLLATSDVISYHVPLTPTTQNMLSAQEIRQVKPHALVINTSRGGVVHFKDAVQAVQDNRLGGFACDVFLEEPVDLGHLQHENLYFTPHIGGNAKEAVDAMGQQVISHIRNYIEQDASRKA